MCRACLKLREGKHTKEKDAKIIALQLLSDYSRFLMIMY